MNSQPNLSHMAVFAAVARHSSFQKAASDAGMSTSAVSHAIRGLEERLGVVLFHRTTRSVSLTEAGQRFLERIQPALRDVSEAMEEMNHFRAAPAGTLRINAARTAAYLLIAPLMSRFLAAYPDINFEVADDDGFVDVIAGGFDAGVRIHEGIPEDMVGVSLGGPQRMAIVASPDYFAERDRPIHPNDLLQHQCIRIRFPSGRTYRWEFEKDNEALDIEVNGRLTLGDTRLIAGAAIDGLGIACVFEDLVTEPLRDGKLVRVLEDWCAPFHGFMLYYPRQRRMTSALRAFIDLASHRSNWSSTKSPNP
ncbi:MAG TPA: LysR family transcriptional regulator [Afipia sp.]